jgi:hypothetical protein
MASVSEIKQSRRRRRTLDGLGDSESRTWRARWFGGAAEAEEAVLAVAPSEVDGYPILETFVNEVYAERLYTVELIYAKQVFDPEFQFEIATRETLRLVPIEMRSSHPSSFPTPQVIHDRGDGTADGVRVLESDYSFSERYYFAKSFVNGAYKATLFSCSGKMIDRAWRGFQKGEVALVGVTGSQRGNLPWQLDFRFHARPNAVNQAWSLEGGSVTVPMKYGHDYQWFTTLPKAPAVGATEPAPAVLSVPTATHVAQVIGWFNPLLLSIGT